jgi:hypothetical protein
MLGPLECPDPAMVACIGGKGSGSPAPPVGSAAEPISMMALAVLPDDMRGAYGL